MTGPGFDFGFKTLNLLNRNENKLLPIPTNLPHDDDADDDDAGDKTQRLWLHLLLLLDYAPDGTLSRGGTRSINIGQYLASHW